MSSASGKSPAQEKNIPWQYSATLGGEFSYDAQNDTIVLRDGRRFARPPRVSKESLHAATRPRDTPSASSPNEVGFHGISSLEQRFVKHRSWQARNPNSVAQSAGPSQKHLQSPSPTLFPDYRERPAKFFKVGRVFLILWAEPAGGTSSVTSYTNLRSPPTNTVLNHFGQPVFSKIRRFVVIREGSGFCSAIPISTYGGRGVSKPGARKSEHAIIYTGSSAPSPLPTEEPRPGADEKPMQPVAIRVDPDSSSDKLDPTSRLDFSSVHTIQHNLKVKPFGQVNSRSMEDLQKQFWSVWAGSAAHAPSTTLQSAPRGVYTSNDDDDGEGNDDEEEDDEDDEDDEEYGVQDDDDEEEEEEEDDDYYVG